MRDDESQEVILRNLVRQHAFEYLEKRNHSEAGDFSRLFTVWIPRKPGSSSDETDRHPIHLLCDYFHNYLASSEFRDLPPVQELDRLIFGKIYSTTPVSLQFEERLKAHHYDYCKQDQGKEIQPNFKNGELIGLDPIWLETLAVLSRAAKSNFPVIITGETGTGKEVAAHFIHENSQRSGAECVIVNCAALPDTLVESELFGYSPGSFTGASKSGQRGWVEIANGGTLVLDEITELSPHAQSVLLRALQNGEIQKIGGKTVTIDFRLISLTNRLLESEVEAGSFRIDLYYRVSVIPVVLPPLRCRTSDISLLAEHFLERFLRSNQDMTARRFSPEAFKMMCDYSWTGNIRELQNVVARALVLCQETTIEPSHLIFNTTMKTHLPENMTAATESIRMIPTFSNYDPVDVVSFIHSHSSGITSSEFARHFDCSESTARRRLSELENAEIITHEGKKKASRYFPQSEFITAFQGNSNKQIEEL